MDSNQKTLQWLMDYERETAMWRSIDALLGWDERTGLPPKAGAYRADQIAHLAGVIHRRSTSSEYGKHLEELASSSLASDRNSDHGAVIHRLKREYDKKVKLPEKLVEELSRQSVLGQQAWVEARKENDFSQLKPFLIKIVDLKQQQADAIGFDDCQYDALLDDFEPGESTERVAALLEQLRASLVPIVEKIALSEHRPDTSILHRNYPTEAQQAVGRSAAERIGFDFERGRLDVTAHPFCTEMGPNDIRILTRYNESFFNEAFFGVLHEAGHGIYEQGLRSDWYGLPPGQYVSLGIHESQSRLWENLVGRSEPFWQFFYADVKAAFPEALSEISQKEFYRAVNDVRPSLIRVEADEVTYNLHIIIRFELEQGLLAGDIPIDDLPDAWNERYQNYLGITPETDSMGVLQDVHWSAAALGYFPTYSLGNLYAAQLFDAARGELGDLDQMFASGDFATLRNWLTKNVYERGQCDSPAELIHQISGKELSHEPLVKYLKDKLGPIYEIDL